MAGLVRHVSVTALLDLRRKVRIIFQGAFRLGPPRPIVRPGKARRSGNLYSAHSCLTVPSISPNTFTFNNGLLIPYFQVETCGISSSLATLLESKRRVFRLRKAVEAAE